MSQRVLIACSPADRMQPARKALEAGGVLVHVTDREGAVIAASQEPRGPHVLLLTDSLGVEATAKILDRVLGLEGRPRLVFLGASDAAPEDVEAVFDWDADTDAVVGGVLELLDGPRGLAALVEEPEEPTLSEAPAAEIEEPSADEEPEATPPTPAPEPEIAVTDEDTQAVATDEPERPRLSAEDRARAWWALSEVVGRAERKRREALDAQEQEAAEALSGEERAERVQALAEAVNGSVLRYAGFLDDSPTPEVFALIIGGREDGTFLARRGDEAKSVTFVSGNPVFAVSNSDRLYDPPEKTDELEQVLAEHVLEIFYSLFDWRSGEFSFVRVESPPGVKLPFGVYPPGMLLEGLRRYWSADDIASELGGFGGTVTITSKSPLSPDRFSMTPEEAGALELLDGERTLEQVVEEGPGDADDVARVVYALVGLGVAELELGAEEPVEETAPPQSKEEAIAEALEIAGVTEQELARNKKPRVRVRWKPPGSRQRNKPTSDDSLHELATGDERRRAPEAPQGVHSFDADLQTLEPEALEPLSEETGEDAERAARVAARLEELESQSDAERLGVAEDASAADVRSAYWIRRGEFRATEFPADRFSERTREKVQQIQRLLQDSYNRLID